MTLSSVYKRRKKKRVVVLLILLIILLILLYLSLISGSSGIVWKDSTKLFSLSEQDKTFQIIVNSIRLPRALAGIMVGALLGLSGAVMQGILQNPLASPFTLGISQGAGFGAAIAIIVLPEYTIGSSCFGEFYIAISAFTSSMLCTFCILWMSSKVGMNPTSIILAGVGLGSLFHSGTMFLQYFTDEMNAAATLFWTFGDLSRAREFSLYILLMVFIPASIFFLVSHWKFDALCFGDESAFNKGVNVNKFRMVALIVASLCAAVGVAFFGIIGFIGLIAPHMVRMIIGTSHSILLPLSAIFGGVLLLGADLLARTFLYPIVLPVGILTSFIGAPLLLYLLVTLKRIKE
ncbi:FecCD family ABC transporter permease [Sulfurospirillum arcachonense]|uniref:FecCD family ABC transporter permease n=1 Tax=Sulfurospirillum arcachonense TaxID=57666 RepID=UPI00046A7BF1|nr:iron ABC transporter permease [Sulfurospirillum arcachonense]